MEVRVDERRIGVDNRRTDGAVDQRDVGDLHLPDPAGERRRVHPLGRGAQVLLPPPQIDAVRIGDEPLAVGEADHRDVEALRQQIRALLLQLTQHRAADVADADHRQRQPRVGLEKALMDGVERAHLLRRVDHARDVALRGPLRNRADVDVLPPERVEYLAGDAGAPFHPLANHGEDRLVVPHIDLHRAGVKLELELLADRLDRALRVRALRTLKQIVCSDEACEISTTLTPLPASVPNTRPATPGTPTIPGPRSVSNASSPTDVIPFASFPSSTALRAISVPGAAGLKVFLIRIGMRFATAGAMLAECSTLAPKYDSSIASS